MTLPPNHSRHFPPPIQHHHATSRRNLPTLGTTIPQPPSMSPSGHMLINLQEGSRNGSEVKFGLRNPERMPAASEVPPDKKPRPTKTEIMEFNRAVATLQKVDLRIPAEITRKAVHLLFSTNLLPELDLEKPYIIDLPSTNMLALILPLPESSHFQMPPLFKNHQNHTWALLHGTTIGTSQAILLEGKIRPANWSYNKDYTRCDMPTFGAFYLGREVANSDTFPDWAAKELMDTIQKKGKGQQDIIVGAMYRGACQHTAFKAGGNEMAQLSVAEKGMATTSEKYTIAHSNHVGLKFVALKRQNLPQTIDADDSSTDDCTYRSINARTKDHQTGRWDDHRPQRWTASEPLCTSRFFGITRKPEFTFLGKPGQASIENCTVAPICH